MALTVSNIITQAKYYLDDTSITTSEALLLINLGRKEIAKESNILTDSKTYSGSTSTNKINLTDTMYKVYNLKMNVGNTSGPILPVTVDNWDRLDFSQTSDRYNYYLEDGRTLYFYPTLTQDASTGTLDSDITTGSSVITINTTEDFAYAGRGLIGSEVVEWYGTTPTGTQLILNNVTRGLEGTTATAHATGATLIERNIRINYIAYPNDVSAGDSVESIFNIYPEVITYYVCWKYKERDTDDVQATGSKSQAMFFRQKYEEYLNKMFADVWTSNDTNQTVRRIRGR